MTYCVWQRMYFNYRPGVIQHPKAGPLVRGELTIYDLPPVEDLKISIHDKVELVQLGTVDKIIDFLSKYLLAVTIPIVQVHTYTGESRVESTGFQPLNFVNKLL